MLIRSPERQSVSTASAGRSRWCLSQDRQAPARPPRLEGSQGSLRTTAAAPIPSQWITTSCRLPLRSSGSPRKRLDTELFKQHIELLSRCQPIDVPAFDFTIQDRKPGFRLEYKPGDIVIMEGIHALNPDVIGHSDEYTNRVYVSVRTRLESGGELLHPSKIRLMRRLIRDKLYRGRSITETMEFFKSVERGEDLYIMPYKHRASFDIDTFIAYEPMVYRDILLDDLHRVSRTYPEYGKYADIEKFLRKLEPLDPANVPDNSLVREFIG